MNLSFNGTTTFIQGNIKILSLIKVVYKYNQRELEMLTKDRPNESIIV